LICIFYFLSTKKQFFALEGYRVPVIQFGHLIQSKIISDRAKDKADVEELQKIKKKGK
jgi:hypothetical protein